MLSTSFFWKGDDFGSEGVGVLVAGKWIDNIISIIWKINNQLYLCTCSSTRSLGWSKRWFLWTTACFSHFSSPIKNSCSSCWINGHVGQHSQGFSSHDGGYGYGTLDQEGMRILDFCAATDLAVTNTFFRKKNSQLVACN